MLFRLTAIAATAVLIGSLSVASAADNTVTFKLNAENGSNETGTATLTPVEGGVKVDLKVAGTGDVAQPVHIHTGQCGPKLNPKPAYPLTTIQNGTSSTTVKGVTLEQLESGDYAINAHKSTSDVATYVACGNIPAAKGGDAMKPAPAASKYP